MSVYTASLKGLRPQNEDNHIAKHCNNIGLYAVFDGHGGKQVSNFLKEHLPKFFLDKRVQYPLSKKYVNNVYDYLQTSITKHPFSKNTGSTALVVIHFKNNGTEYLNVINTGDCRCVLCRDNFAMPLTKDHKPNWPEEYHRITQLGGKIEFDGYDFRIKDLSVSRAFGDVDATPFVTHHPDLFRYRLDKNDKFMIICCDGAVDQLSNSEMVNFVLVNCYDATFTNRINKNINIAKKLAEYAIKRGSTDNVSCVIVFFD